MAIVVQAASPATFPLQTAGRSPALSTDDLPLPEGPITARKAVSDRRTASSATSWSRPKPGRLLALGPQAGKQLPLERLLQLGSGRRSAVFSAEPLDHGLEGVADVAAAGRPQERDGRLGRRRYSTEQGPSHWHTGGG